MRISIAVALSATLITQAGPAAAEAFYFHKPQVARDAFVGDYEECRELATGVVAPRLYVYSPDIVTAAAGSFFAGFFASRERRHLVDNVLRTCMADKGYRRISPVSDVRKQLGKLEPAARVERLFALAAAPVPEGKVLPR